MNRYLSSNVPPVQQAPFITNIALGMPQGAVVTLATLATILSNHPGPFEILGYDFWNQTNSTALIALLGSPVDTPSTGAQLAVAPMTGAGDDVSIYGIVCVSAPSVTPGVPICFFQVRCHA